MGSTSGSASSRPISRRRSGVASREFLLRSRTTSLFASPWPPARSQARQASASASAGLPASSKARAAAMSLFSSGSGSGAEFMTGRPLRRGGSTGKAPEKADPGLAETAFGFEREAARGGDRTFALHADQPARHEPGRIGQPAERHRGEAGTVGRIEEDEVAGPGRRRDMLHTLGTNVRARRR